MGGFTVKVDDAAVQDRLARLGAASGNLSPVMDDLGRMLQVRIQRQFELQAPPGGGKWVPLTARTIAQRQKRGRWPGPMLRQTGDLYRSVTYKASASEVVVGTNWAYAALQQFGGKTGRGGKVRVPARPYMLTASGELPTDWLGAAVRQLEQHLATAGGGK